MMVSGVASALRMEELQPPIDGGSSGAPPKPTNSPELGQEPLSDGPNEGPPPKLGMVLVPRPMAIEGWPKKVVLRGSGPAIEAPRRV
jgi:hypothetical protein